MQTAQPEYDIGVIVGRFQVHELHQGHRDLIQHVLDRHEKVVILLGLSPLATSTNNPLDFEARKQLLLSEFPDVNVLYIKDQASDEVWSRKLDEIVEDLVLPGQSVVLYGGRDSFIAHYQGKFPTQELVQTEHYSGTAVRKQIARSRTRSSADFRAGVIWASTARYPTCYPTVDVAVLHYDRLEDRKTPSASWSSCPLCQPRSACVRHKQEAAAFYAPEQPIRVLLARKPNERLYRFMGGFADPRCDDFEQDARREVAEEGGIEIGDVQYIGSRRVDDWRYNNEPDCIKTLLFKAKYLHGRPTPGDDIEEVRWFNFNEVSDRMLEPVHRPLMEMLLDNLKES